MIPLKLNNSTVTNTKDREVDEISHKEFKNMFIRMINELKEERINA
jgi:hypothetical protein